MAIFALKHFAEATFVRLARQIKRVATAADIAALGHLLCRTSSNSKGSNERSATILVHALISIGGSYSALIHDIANTLPSCRHHPRPGTNRSNSVAKTAFSALVFSNTPIIFVTKHTSLSRLITSFASPGRGAKHLIEHMV